MKIGYLVQTLDRKTGGGRFAADIIDGVRGSGHEVIVLREEGDNQDGFRILGRGLRVFTSVSKVRKLLSDCDVIHAIDGYPFGLTAALANRTLRKKLIISALGTYAVAPLYIWQTSYLLKWAYQSAFRVVPISHFTEREIFKKVRLDNSIVITPGIKSDSEVETPSRSNDNFILGVGAIKERKGYHIALSAFATLSKDFPQLKYVIVADPFPPFQAILDKIIFDNNLQDRVTFLDHISDEKLEKLYKEARLFVLTPISSDDHHIEGFGLVYLEAARAGLPVIGTIDTGAEDAINNSYNGILVPQRDVQKTAEAMRAILSNQEKRRQMSTASRDWSKSNSLEREIFQILKVYETSKP